MYYLLKYVGGYSLISKMSSLLCLQNREFTNKLQIYQYRSTKNN